MTPDRRAHLLKIISEEKTLAGLEWLKGIFQNQGEWTEMVGEWTRRKVAIIEARASK